MKRLKEAVLASLPPEWPESLLSAIQDQVKADGRKVVVLDDDPTGTQTVANIPVLTEWSVEALSAELQGETAAFFILTNSRSLPEAEALRLNREIGQNLTLASRQAGRDFALVSRSDSTLRGHFPAEMEALQAVLPHSFDGWLLIPFFQAGGRFTIDDVHYVEEGDALVPAGETPFARDATFGYRASNLREWVAEKTDGRIPAKAVQSISLKDIRQGGPKRVQRQLEKVSQGRVVIVNAVSRRDLEVFTRGLLGAEAAGKRFLYRTAASFVPVRAGLALAPLLTPARLELPTSGGGLIIVGSYVPKSTRQLESLLRETAVQSVEIQVAALLDKEAQAVEVARVAALAEEALAAEKDVVIFTSRTLVQSYRSFEGLALGQQISRSLVEIVQKLTSRPRYLLAKGGITSSDIATYALHVRRALVAGQILPGVPVWRLGEESRQPGLNYIVFPGNVGDQGALVRLVRSLARER